ncbi:MAG TPA: YicC/YloC family endoribonuclease [bacterium]|nr:YicC/YloC family endoribonuclease [bacterium]
MIRSMTGFGTGEAVAGSGRYAIEVRSVNHRFCEIIVRLPRDLAALEDRAKALVQGRVLRGRVDVAIIREEQGKRTRTVKADLDLAEAYIKALNDLKQALSISGPLDLSMFVSLPDLIRIEEQKDDLETLWPALSEGIGGAVNRLVAMRETEGARLESDLDRRIARLEEHITAIEERAPSVVQEYHARLERRVQEFAGGVPVDPARLATEVAMFAERADVAEEITRFRGHLAQFRATLGSNGAVGRTLEFIVQELGREANTIGSKANDLAITRLVIAVKGELESLREQIQNVE